MPVARIKDKLKTGLKGVLVIASSGRMLALTVRQAGYLPLVIDLYADQDTEVIAEQLWKVESLSLAAVQKVVEKLLLSYEVQWLIYGSGMECQINTLTYLTELFTVVGNNSAVCKQLSCKMNFFKQLDKLGVCHPDVRFSMPADPPKWLIKPFNHLGGVGIHWCDRKTKGEEYYQKFCTGQSGSVLFCADGRHFDLIGFHRQWTIDQDSFIFAGIIQESILPETEQKTVQSWVEKLVNYYQLKGLGSLDFIWNGETCYFLEINPRPPASMMLYPDLNLLRAHQTGQLTVPVQDTSVRALQIIYAKQDCKNKQMFEWPEWSFDRPKLNAGIQANEPICSIMAQGKSVQQALNSLLEKQIFIENHFY